MKLSNNQIANLKEAKLYLNPQTASYKINAVYEVEDDEEINQVCLIGIDISSIIPKHYLPYVVHNATIDNYDISRSYEVVTSIELDDKKIPINDIVIKTIKTKTKEMTIEEIEKALGHKIKIVGGDK